MTQTYWPSRLSLPRPEPARPPMRSPRRYETPQEEFLRRLTLQPRWLPGCDPIKSIWELYEYHLNNGTLAVFFAMFPELFPPRFPEPRP